jgi:hypothetical protein
VAESWLAERRGLGFPLLQGAPREAWLAAQGEAEAEPPAAALLPLA